MKIVVLDGYTENPGDLSWDGLKALGELTVYDRSSLTDPNDAISRIGDAEIVFTNKTPITRQVLDACPNVRFIAVLATGYNVVDVAYAKEKGIPVSNVPTYGTDSVSQFAIALLLELCHHIGRMPAPQSGPTDKNPTRTVWKPGGHQPETLPQDTFRPVAVDGVMKTLSGNDDAGLPAGAFRP